MGMAHIIVGLNLTKGLVDSITLSKGKYTHMIFLYDDRFPFKYNKFHTHGHLGVEGQLLMRNENGSKRNHTS